jgi:hypothetical protein
VLLTLIQAKANKDGTYTVDCTQKSTFPTLTFYINNNTFALTPDHYIQQVLIDYFRDHKRFLVQSKRKTSVFAWNNVFGKVEYVDSWGCFYSTLLYGV